MKIIIFLIIVAFAIFCKAQEPVVFTKTFICQDLKDYQERFLYKGRVFRINDNLIFRSRTYGRNFVQFTMIYKLGRYELRAYEYFNIINNKLTPAVSIRKKI